MNILRSAIAPAILTAAMAFTACGDKMTPVLIEQGERLNSELQTLAQENPALIAEAKAAFADNRMTVDVKLADSLFMVAQITEPLFNYFEIKNHLDKNLEVTVNALSEKDAPIAVNLTDVYGDSKTYELSPALIRRMVKSPLAQLDFNEAKTALFAAFETSEEQFRPETEGPVTGFPHRSRVASTPTTWSLPTRAVTKS
jgi:hypothetical protein